MKRKLFVLLALCFMLVGIFSGCSAKENCKCNEGCGKNYYVVYFHLNNFETPMFNIVKENDTIDFDFFKDLEHKKSYLKFNGWSADSELQVTPEIENEFNPETKITKNINLYANWYLKEGYSYYVVMSSSMNASNILIGDVLACKEYIDGDVYKVGDIIYFNKNSLPIVNEIVEVIDNDGEITYKTKGTSVQGEFYQTVSEEEIVGEIIDIILRDGELTNEKIIYNK